MHDQTQSFGSYLKKHRSGKMTLRAFADEIGITPAYISDIENDRRDPPGKDLLDKMAEALSIKGSDLIELYDLAGKGREEVSPDLPDYIMNSDISDTVRLALRTAKDNDASLDDWLHFIEEVKNKQKKQTKQPNNG